VGALLRREDGQTVVEYGLLLVLILFVAFGVIVALGQNVLGLFQDITTKIS